MHPPPNPCRYVEDSAAYSAGLLSTAEALPAARQQRDAGLKRVLLEPLQARSPTLETKTLLQARQGVLLEAVNAS